MDWRISRDRVSTLRYTIANNLLKKRSKVFSIFQDETPPKVHLLGVLITAAAQYDLRFALFSDAADLLTPLATEYCYPGSLHEPTRAEFDKAYQYADEIYRYVISLLPADTHPKQ